MKTELVQTLTATFEGHAQQTEGGIEYWLARDIQHLLGYSNWAFSRRNTLCHAESLNVLIPMSCDSFGVLKGHAEKRTKTEVGVAEGVAKLDQ